MNLRALLPLFLLTASAAIPAYAETATTAPTQETIERLEASQPVTIDLGTKMAVVFYYTDANGDRLLVTAIGPKNPDSDAVATQQIIKMNSAGEYVINIDSDEKGTDSVKLSAYFEGSELIVSFDKV